MKFQHAPQASQILGSTPIPQQAIQRTIQGFFEDPGNASRISDEMLFEVKFTALKGGNASHVQGSVEVWFSSTCLVNVPTGKITPAEILTCEQMIDGATHVSKIFNLVKSNGAWGLATTEEVVDFILGK